MDRKWLLLVGGKYHDWEGAAKAFSAILGKALGIRTEVLDDPQVLAGNLGRYGGILLYRELQAVPKALAAGLDRFVREQGRPLVAVHCASVYEKNPTLFQLLGVRFTGHPPVRAFPVALAPARHWITQRLFPFRVTDELY